jgi:triacylglycerol esterase/lipase EstA (alpha/beta hydrolase family)
VEDSREPGDFPAGRTERGSVLEVAGPELEAQIEESLALLGQHAIELLGFHFT